MTRHCRKTEPGMANELCHGCVSRASAHLSTADTAVARCSPTRPKLRIAATLVLALALGCSSEDPPATPVPDADPVSVAPGQLRAMLDGLNSDNPRTQYGALLRLSEYPTVIATYREQIERLQTDGANDKVRQKAAELLAALEEPPAEP